MQFCLWCSMTSNAYPSGNKVIMGDVNGANVCDSLPGIKLSGRPRQHYPPPSIRSYYYGQINSTTMSMTMTIG